MWKIFRIHSRDSTSRHITTKHRSGHIKLVDERAARRLVRQTRVDRKRSLSDVTSKCNKNNNANVSSKAIWRSLKRYRMITEDK